MALAEQATLIVDLRLKDGLTAGIKGAQRSVAGMESSAKRLQGAFSKIGQGFKFGTGFFLAERVLRSIPSVINSAVQSLDELQSVEAQTGAVIKSTGAAAQVTARQIRDMSVALEDQTTIDDKIVQRGANLLLTFTNIQNRVGEGNDIFNQATTAILDMSTALGTDVKQSAIQLGKALNDPVKGITALRRVGVAFTESQVDLIKSLVKEGKILEAQKIILAEINTEFGGSAVAQAGTYAGQVRRLGDAFEELKLVGIKAALPGLTRLVTNLADTLRNPAFVKGAEDFGKGIADMLTAENFRAVKDFVTTTIPPLVDGLKLAAEAAKTVVGVFRSLPPELQKAIVLGVVANKLSGGLVGSLAGGLVKGGVGAAIGGLRGSTPATPVFTKEVGLGGAGGVGKPGGLPPIIPVAILAAAAVGVAQQVIEATEFRNARKDLTDKTPGLTNAQALALQVEARGGLASLDRRNAEGVITAIRNEGKTYEQALREAKEAIVGQQQMSTSDLKTAQTTSANTLATAIGTLKAPVSLIPGQLGVIATNMLTGLQGVAGAIRGFSGTVNDPRGGTRPSAGLPGNAGSSRGTPVTKTPRSGNENNRGVVALQSINVSVSTDHRQNSQAATTQARYGPTPSMAGAA